MQPLGPKQTEQLHTPPTAPLARSLPLMRNLLRVPRPHPGPKLACRVRRVRSLPLMRNLLRVPRLHLGLNLACRVRRVHSLLRMRNLLRAPKPHPGLKLVHRAPRVRSQPFMRNLLRMPRPHPGPKLVCRVRRVLRRERETPEKGEQQNSKESIQRGADPLHGLAPFVLTRLLRAIGIRQESTIDFICVEQN